MIATILAEFWQLIAAGIAGLLFVWQRGQAQKAKYDKKVAEAERDATQLIRDKEREANELKNEELIDRISKP